jgi:3-oxoacyl-[acyl-carrier protein] reductase
MCGFARRDPQKRPGSAEASRTLTREFAAQGVNVNSVAPGLIDNNFHAVFTPKDAFEAQISSIPMGRAGTSEEVAGAGAFLASPAASFVNGEVIHVNGGAHFGQ